MPREQIKKLYSFFKKSSRTVSWFSTVCNSYSFVRDKRMGKRFYQNFDVLIYVRTDCTFWSLVKLLNYAGVVNEFWIVMCCTINVLDVRRHVLETYSTCLLISRPNPQNSTKNWLRFCWKNDRCQACLLLQFVDNVECHWNLCWGCCCYEWWSKLTIEFVWYWQPRARTSREVFIRDDNSNGVGIGDVRSLLVLQEMESIARIKVRHSQQNKWQSAIDHKEMMWPILWVIDLYKSENKLFAKNHFNNQQCGLFEESAFKIKVYAYA